MFKNFNPLARLFNYFRNARQSKATDASVLARRMKEKENDKENKIMAAKLKRQEKAAKKQNQLQVAKANNYK